MLRAFLYRNGGPQLERPSGGMYVHMWMSEQVRGREGGREEAREQECMCVWERERY